MQPHDFVARLRQVLEAVVAAGIDQDLAAAQTGELFVCAIRNAWPVIPSSQLVRHFLHAFLSWPFNSQLPKHGMNLLFKRRQVILNHPPYVIEIDAQILVHQHVAETGDIPPRHIGV